mmetsp:Transcript_16335/g.23039  ORF Transcript_16335/g.23039 Transcript_16335/m.23039 type:complete len:441 (+) Transcript_16335:111-1433(+)
MKDEISSSLSSDEVERKQRAAARWKILRSALLGKSKSSMTKNASIHRFAGFQMLSKQKVVGETSPTDEMEMDESNNNFALYDYTIQPQHSSTRTNTSISTSSSSTHREEDDKVPVPLRVRTRERIPNEGQKIDLRALTSHRHYGVDNTGNARVWDSEATLTHCLIQSCGDDNNKSSVAAITSNLGLSNLWNLATSHHNGNNNTLHVVELGAGMAGIAGLTLAAMSMAGFSGDHDGRRINVNVVLTDGHPDAVQNNRTNASLTTSLYNTADGQNHQDRVTIESTRLLWKDCEEGANDCINLIASNSQRLPFDLCLASDCVHFQEFHAALALTVARLLRVDGVAIFCQPHRSNSLQRFMDLLDYMNKRDEALWEVSLIHDYDEEMSKRHEQYLKHDSSYDPSIHYPSLLLLRKLRAFDESLDREMAVRHMAERDIVKTHAAK